MNSKITLCIIPPFFASQIINKTFYIPSFSHFRSVVSFENGFQKGKNKKASRHKVNAGVVPHCSSHKGNNKTQDGNFSFITHISHL